MFCAAGGRRGRAGRLGREHARRARGGGARLHLRQGDPRRQPRHARRQPGPVRAALAAAGLLHAARRGPGARALGGAPRDGSAQPRRPLHAEPDAGQREGRGRCGRGDGQPGRVALARPAQAPFRAGDGRARAARARRRQGPRGRDAHALDTLGALDGSVELAATSGLARHDPGRRVRSARGDGCLAAAGPAHRGRPVDARRLDERERGARVARRGRVRARAGRRPRARSRRRLRRGRRPRGARRDAGRAGPRARGGLPSGPLAARRARDRHDGRALHVPRLPRGRAPRRRGGPGRDPGRSRQRGARVGLHAHAGARRRPADAVHGSRLARDHLGEARRGPASRALGPRRDRSRPHGRPGLALRRPAVRRAHERRPAHGVRGRRTLRQQLRHARRPRLRQSPSATASAA